MKYFVILLLFLGACANVGMPTGGKKDEIAPQLLQAFPADQSTLFKGKTIELVFDEDIEVRNLKKNLVITPDLNNEYKFLVRNNILRLDFEKDFAENTTFVFNFGEGVVDLTEGNKAQNLRMAFSTGKYLDSLYISGTVRNAATRKAVANALVGIYDTADTLEITTERPIYFTRTDTTGYFRLENIRPATYKLYALVEGKKQNQLYESEDEQIAFLDKQIVIDGFSIPDQNVFLSRYDLKKLEIKSARPRREYFEVIANKTIVESKVVLDSSSYRDSVRYVAERDVIRFYNLGLKDSLKAQIWLKDSVGNEVKDTVFVKFTPSNAKKRPTALGFEVNPPSGTPIFEGQKIELAFNFIKPVGKYQADSVLYKQDADTAFSRFEEKDFEWNDQKTLLKIKKSFAIKKTLNISILDSAFLSIEGDTAVARPLAYSIANPDNFGAVSGKVQTDVPNYILELVNTKFEVEKSLQNPKSFRFDFVNPGIKKFRFIFDQNANGKWDKGDFEKGILPEKVVILDLDNELKAAWEIEDVFLEIENKN